MIDEFIILKLDELIGDFNTPFFNYLLYSYDLSLDDCERIIGDIKNDISSNEVNTQNIVSVIDKYFKLKVVELEKEDKVEYLAGLIQEDNDYFVKYLKKYNLNDSQINMVYDKVKGRIFEDNIDYFEIKRFLRYYFSNYVKQESYINDLEFIVGRNYDTLIVRKVKRNYPILLLEDIVRIVDEIRFEILDAVDFPNGIKNAFLKKAMLFSEAKKAEAKVNLAGFVEDSGDSFDNLVKVKNLSKSDGQRIVLQIEEDINSGLIQPSQIDSVFITNRFNEYIENEN